MLLSQLIGKTLVHNNTPRGKCLGVGISPKNKSLKYLFCSTEECDDFVLPVTTLLSLSENALFLSRVRPVLPKPCAKLLAGVPVFSSDGKFLGRLTDAELQNQTLVRIYTDREGEFPSALIAVISDAILLRKALPYPLGQPLSDQNEPFVTKRVLRKSICTQSLIRLTLSLPPFHHRIP